MKKTFISVIFISLVLVLSSCKKENIGIFAPQKKINKIFLKYGTTDVLKEEWFWNNGLLTRIDYYKSNGLTLDYSEFFTYENNRIIEVSAKNEKLNYCYDDNKLTKINYYYGNQYIENYELIYDKNVIKKIIISIENDIDKSEERLLSPLKKIDPSLNISEIFVNNGDTKGLKRGEIKLSWSDNNIVRVDIDRDVLFPLSVYSTTYNYTYDTQKNPFANRLSYNINNLFDETFINGGLEKNNILSSHKTTYNSLTSSYETESWTYDYEYKNKYPISIKTTYTTPRGISLKKDEYVISYY